MTDRRVFLFVGLAVLLAVCFLLCLGVGGNFYNPLAIFSGDISPVLRLRMYRLLAAFVVGASLSMAGVAYQAVLRNPLAEPYILGISGGASIGAALAIASGLAAVSSVFIPLCSFAAAILVLACVLSLARGAGSEYSVNVLLSGIVVGTVCSSLLMFMISVMNIQTLHTVTWWMLGSLDGNNPELLYTVFAFAFLCGGLLFLFGRDANILSMGEEAAFHFGISPRASSLIILCTASLLTASAVALSGIIGFVGLIVPHVIRHLSGACHRRLFPLAFFCGGMFLMVCDTFARTAMYPHEIPVGVITACLGGPFFLWLINRKSASSR